MPRSEERGSHTESIFTDSSTAASARAASMFGQPYSVPLRRGEVLPELQGTNLWATEMGYTLGKAHIGVKRVDFCKKSLLELYISD